MSQSAFPIEVPLIVRMINHRAIRSRTAEPDRPAAASISEPESYASGLHRSFEGT